MNEMLRERWQEKMQESGPGSFLQEHSHLGHEHFADLFADHPSCFVQMSEGHQHRAPLGMSNEECFHQFNPPAEDEFNSVVENWSSAYLDMSRMIVERLNGKVQAAPPPAMNSTDA